LDFLIGMPSIMFASPDFAMPNPTLVGGRALHSVVTGEILTTPEFRKAGPDVYNEIT
jgi:hypothetical protein